MRGMDCGESSACGMHAYGNHCCYKKLVVSFTTTELDRRSSSVVPEVSLNLIKFRTVSADFHSFVDAIEFLVGVRHSKVAGSTITIFIFLTVLKFSIIFKIFI